MNGPVVLDTNLLALLIVGSTSKEYITIHKRLAADFTSIEFELLVELTGMFSDIVLLPHIVSETSSLLRQINNPVRAKIQDKFNMFITTTMEYPIASAFGARRGEFQELGITDAVILHFLSLEELNPTLLSIDDDLLNRANSLGYSVIDCRTEFWPRRS